MDRGGTTGRRPPARTGATAGDDAARTRTAIHPRLASRRQRRKAHKAHRVCLGILLERSGRMRAALAIVTVVSLTGSCAPMGPDYQRPDVETPSHFKESGTWKFARPADHLPRGAWWTVFGDPVLNRLEN